MAHILVIDDDDLVRLYLLTVLSNAGHTVQETDSGQNCLEQIARNHIDLIITDIFMPNMDGLELLAVLDKLHPTNKVIAMSGGGSTMSRKLALKVARKFGAIAFITKPFQIGDVINTVSRALSPPGHDLQAQD
ncbi:MAG: response regulator [Magnetococcales bacterium]|nr:response regulator [Magnetococcales bacterium]